LGPEMMKYNSLVTEFIKFFPEFEAESKNFLKNWEDEELPVHVFFENILTNFLVRDGLVKMENLELLKRIFEFMENMANSEDKYVQEVLTDSILASFGGDENKNIRENARKLMGKETLILSYIVQIYK
jgi:hypothetical protein